METLADNTITLPDELINAIITEVTSAMQKLIENISPEDDPSADYGEGWTTGSCCGDGWLELAKPFDEYVVSYDYVLSWRYREWTEYWTDPDCTRNFYDMANECGSIENLTIISPDGDEVEDSICKEIVKTINEKIK